MLPKYQQDDIQGAFAFYKSRPMTSKQSYIVFYMLWFLALLEGINYADMLINIDQLSESNIYRNDILREMSRFEIEGIDFSDCSVSQGYFSKEQLSFFAEAEAQVHLWLINGGYPKEELKKIEIIRSQYQSTCFDSSTKNLNSLNLIEQTERFQEMTRRFETLWAEQCNRNVILSEEARIKIQRAEDWSAKSLERESRIQNQLEQALTVAKQAQDHNLLAESRAREMRDSLETAHQEIQLLRDLAEGLQQQINAVYSSRSWRLTLPLRKSVNIIRRIFS